MTVAFHTKRRGALLTKAALRALHLFDSRNSAFKDDQVLQENVIVMLERGARQGDVTITTSTDDAFADLRTELHPFDRIVFPGDAERFIHIPTAALGSELETMRGVRHSLDELDVRVSTGPVVDFRLASHLRAMPEPDTAPLIYPMHLAGGRSAIWPQPGAKKPNAIRIADETLRWMMPNGFYCVVKRFSSKEERRRIVASTLAPSDFPPETEFLGLENHLNVFHSKRRGLPAPLAYGLTVYLNSTPVDEAFRRFSGHTQVNAGDLRKLRYPSREVLIELGVWGQANATAGQAEIDAKVRGLTV